MEKEVELCLSFSSDAFQGARGRDFFLNPLPAASPFSYFFFFPTGARLNVSGGAGGLVDFALSNHEGGGGFRVDGWIGAGERQSSGF